MQTGKRQFGMVLGRSEFLMVLDGGLLGVLHSSIPFLHQLALCLNPSVHQPLQVTGVGSFLSGEITSHFLGFGLQLGFNNGQPVTLLFDVSELSVLLTKLSLQLGYLFLGSLQLGGMSRNS